jgi:hypothetical protein
MSVPVHAAGTKHESCSDYFVSSYTPTLSALVEARRDPPRIMRENVRTLLAATKVARGLPTLWNVHEEVAVVKSIISPFTVLNMGVGDSHVLEEREIHDINSGNRQREDQRYMIWTTDGTTNTRHMDVSDSTLGDVFALLPHADIVHLACHGEQDSADPLASGFRLADQTMTVRDLMRLKLDKPLLAYLGACDTAKGHDDLAEEAFHLCSAMLFTGFRSVIGTMW